MNHNFEFPDLPPGAQFIVLSKLSNQLSCLTVNEPVLSSKACYQGFQHALSGDFVLPTKGRQHLALVNDYENDEIERKPIVCRGAVVLGNRLEDYSGAQEAQVFDDHIRNASLLPMNVVEHSAFGNDRSHAQPMQISRFPKYDDHVDPKPLSPQQGARNQLARDANVTQTSLTFVRLKKKSRQLSTDALLRMVLRVRYRREQLNQLKELRSFATQEIGRLSGRNERANEMTVLEELDGYVDQIEDGSAFVTLTSKSGEELIGEYPANELASIGIRECRRFKCQSVIIDGRPDVRFQAIPDAEITSDEANLINREIRELTSGEYFDGDY